MPGSVSYHLIPKRKNHLDNAGIEPGLPAQQASALSITPLPLGQSASLAKEGGNLLLKLVGSQLEYIEKLIS